MDVHRTPATRLLDLKKPLHQWVDETDDLVKELNNLADNLDEHFKRISKAKIGGSAAAIGGGIMAAVGFGLSFVTFGASLGLTIAGSVIAEAGGTTAAGSSITDLVLSRNRQKSAEEIVKKYKSRVENLKKDCVEIGNLLEAYGNIDGNFPSWVKFWAKLIFKGGSGAANIGWNVITRTVLTSIKIASVAEDAAGLGARAGANAFKTIGTTAGRGFHIVGGVVGILLMPIDIYVLVDASIDVHKKNPHKTSECIRKLAAELKKECPNKNDIDTMIENTLQDINSV